MVSKQTVKDAAEKMRREYVITPARIVGGERYLFVNAKVIEQVWNVLDRITKEGVENEGAKT